MKTSLCLGQTVHTRSFFAFAVDGSEKVLSEYKQGRRTSGWPENVVSAMPAIKKLSILVDMSWQTMQTIFLLNKKFKKYISIMRK